MEIKKFLIQSIVGRVFALQRAEKLFPVESIFLPPSNQSFCFPFYFAVLKVNTYYNTAAD